jgi:transcriptional regulator with XRE-family HTH domain
MNLPNLETFHERLDYLIRRQKRLTTQSELGSRVGVSQSHISGLRNGISQPSRNLVGKLELVLGCTAGWLEYGNGDGYEISKPMNAHDLEPMCVFIKEVYGQIKGPSDKYELIGQTYLLLKKFKSGIAIP